MKSRHLVFTTIILVLVTLVYLNRSRSPQVSFSKEVPRLTSTPIAADSAASEAAPVGNRAPAVEPPAGEPVEPEFQRWIAADMEGVDSPNSINGAEKEIELTQRAAGFQKRHIDYLVRRSLSASSPFSERILSTYLLSLNGDPKALKDIATQAIDNPGPHPAHSPEETLLVQERSKRIMAIEGIFNGALEPAVKLQNLQSIANESADPEVKSYALRKVNELQAQM